MGVPDRCEGQVEIGLNVEKFPFTQGLSRAFFSYIRTPHFTPFLSKFTSSNLKKRLQS